jgi:ParB family transcriptional regulator, chromosome partitioning protein
MSKKRELDVRVVKVEDIKFTKDNARRITEDSLEDLATSIKTLGIIRPLILNDRMELMSGNQRTKTMLKIGVEEAPAIIMEEVAKNDYINFTLLVNSIEHNKSEVTIDNPQEIEYNKFIKVENDRIHTHLFKNPVVRRDIATSIVKYGQWGNVIINDRGQCIFNSDYASTMETIGYPVWVYKVTRKQEKFIMDYFFREYGVYSYDHLNLPSYPQTYVQPQRVIGLGGMGNGMRSVLYDEIAREHFETKDKRIMDFGSGKKAVPNHLKNLGYDITTYEPFFKVVGLERNEITYFDMEEITGCIHNIDKQVTEKGLFDIVMCEAVLNSTVSKKMELYVVATVNSLCSAEGTAYLSSRSLKRLKQFASTNEKNRQSIDNSKRTFELDENGMYLSYRKGHYTAQKYHDEQTLKETLELFFEDVQQVWSKDTCATSIYYKCQKPIQIDEKYLREVLNEEFNMSYPNGYKHNEHTELVETLVKAHNDRHKR